MQPNKIDSELITKETDELKQAVAKELKQPEQTKASMEEIIEKHKKRD